MKPDLTADGVRARLRMAIDKKDGRSVVANKIGVSEVFLCNVILGHKKPSKKILDYLGLERVTVYRRKRAP